MEGTPFVNDIGTSIQLTIINRETDAIVNLSTLLDATFTFARPDGTTFDRTATLYTDGTDGILVYATVDGDFDVAGRWRVQANYELGTGQWSAESEVFTVKARLID